MSKRPAHISIKAIVRKDKVKADGTMPICIQVIVDGKVYRISINEYVILKFWNRVEGKVKKGYPNYSEINGIIDLEISNLKKHLLKLELSGHQPTMDDVKHYYNPIRPSAINLFQFWTEQISNWTGSKVYNTIKNYNVTYNRLKEFTNLDHLPFSSITLDFIQRFDNFLKIHKGNTLAGANTRHKCLKAILKAAIVKGLLDKNPYSYFPLKKVEGRKVYLTIEELKLFESYDFGGNLGLVRDMYVFSCYTGLRILDVTNLEWSNIEGKLIKIQVVKTKKYFNIVGFP